MMILSLIRADQRLRIFFQSLTILVILACFSGCGGGDNPSVAPPATESTIPDAMVEELTVFAPEGGKLVFRGIEMFTTGLPYEIKVMEGVSTEVVIEGLYDGTFDLVFMHRRPRPDEEIDFFELVRSDVVVIIHPDITIDNLTAQEVADIFSGEITNWSQVGAQDLEIVLFILPENDAITEALRAGAFGERPFSETAYSFPDEASVILSAISVPGGVGYATLATKNYLGMVDSIKGESDYNIVSINGIVIGDSAYPMSIMIGFGYLPEREEFLQPLFDWLTEFFNTPQGKQLFVLFNVSAPSGE
jgi:phosphate transport system substrate-binding protein